MAIEKSPLVQWENWEHIFIHGGFSIANVRFFWGAGWCCKTGTVRNWFQPWWILKLELLWRMARLRKSHLFQAVVGGNKARDMGHPDELKPNISQSCFSCDGRWKVCQDSCLYTWAVLLNVLSRFVLSWWFIFAELCSQLAGKTSNCKVRYIIRACNSPN